MTRDYVRWMGIAAWTSGAAIPRDSRGLAVAPGRSPRHILVESAGGSATALEVAEREHTHIQWLLGGAPRDESALDYVRHQDLRITDGALTDKHFAVIDLRDRTAGWDTCSGKGPDYSPEGSIAAARRLDATRADAALAEHVPDWALAEPLGLLALAVREYVTGAVPRRGTQQHPVPCRGAPRHSGRRTRW